MTFERYLEAEHDLNEGLIRVGLSLEREKTGPKDPAARMGEMRSFLAACGDPQKGLPAVHVAGTSGKGSVSAAVAGILSEAGLRVGLHVTPYLQAATEKIWIAGRFVSSDDFADLVDWVMPVARPRVRPETPASIHGMASVAIALEGFRRAGCDVIVFEAGCGARYDLTSFVESCATVVTNVGMDHVVSLGPTLERIAWHKAGVARPGIPLVTGATGEALAPIRAEAEEVGAPIVEVPPAASAWDHNRAVAKEAAARAAEALGVHLGGDAVARGLERVRVAARRERMPGRGPATFLDGAHNAAKLAVAVDGALEDAGPGPRVAVVGFLGTKAGPDLVRPLEGRFDRVVATEPRVYGKTACPARETAALLERVGYDAVEEPRPDEAVERGVELAGEEGTVLVTGSFYLVGQVRERWYSRRSVVEQRTSWPQVTLEK
jgi:dihydrofolate synthase/folylpolyglutamate synthase